MFQKILGKSTKKTRKKEFSRSNSYSGNRIWRTEAYKEASDSSSSSSEDEVNSRPADFHGKITFGFELNRQTECNEKKIGISQNTPTIRRTRSSAECTKQLQKSSNTPPRSSFNRDLFRKQISYSPVITKPDRKPLQPKQLSASTYNEYKLVCYDFIAAEQGDVSVLIGQHVEVLSKPDKDWWWIRTTDGRKGFVPSNFLVDIPVVPSRKTGLLGKVNSFNGTTCPPKTGFIPLKDLHNSIEHAAQQRTSDTFMRSKSFSGKQKRVQFSDQKMVSKYGLYRDTYVRVNFNELVQTATWC